MDRYKLEHLNQDRRWKEEEQQKQNTFHHLQVSVKTSIPNTTEEKQVHRWETKIPHCGIQSEMNYKALIQVKKPIILCNVSKA